MNVRVVNDVHELIPTPGAAGQKLAVSTTAVKLDASLFAATTRVVQISVASNDILVRFDGTDPDATTGQYYVKNTIEYWSVERARAAKFIRASADAVVFASQFTK